MEKKEYSNGDITIVWQPKLCTHSTKCWRYPDSLPEVFDPQERPWIRPENATTDRIVEQINKCPSGALSFYYNADKK